ncbi:patatin-like phospholipase family protein [Cellulomonas sp. URHD0024]|uniref:patatin-like phospholipase family protein n=1 Tax=Cellulomonas sp. URHD0024 TaxID=1302620 RepID=UPI000553A36E|nr:patatin-like phospholipase family protein [Cellulomonas sp. URHD0024]
MRSLVLAGGGMRVAWQAGVVRALQEDGLTFDHVDGASGGIMTAGMLLSGVDGVQMCQRWRGVDVQDFGSALPLRDYLTGPWNLPAVGDADGVLDKVFPALGIDVAAINANPVVGTFNVVDFTTKECLAIESTHIDAPLMAAGMSLPLWLTPLKRDGHVWTDAVWVRDANVAEALRRGADEVWLVWCIGNSPHWGDGPLEQYVHMIEMSAAGALLADFALADAQGRSWVLHVVRPEHPLPLDPEFYLGRVSAESLVQMGYRDARRYLDSRTDAGVVKDASCTAMVDPPPSARFTEHLTGTVDGSPVTLDLTVVMPLDGAPDDAAVAGAIDHGPWRDRLYLADGRVETTPEQFSYHGTLRLDGRVLDLVATRSLVDDAGFDSWSDLDHVDVAVTDRVSGDAALRVRLQLGAGGLAKLVGSVEPVGVHGVLDRADVERRFLARLGRGPGVG